jgi:formylglycine-generating enzyme required for sulfatase activity
VVRGGSWDDDQLFARPSGRDRLSPDRSNRYLGFRLVSPISSGS